MTEWETFWKIAPTCVSVLILVVGFIYTSGKQEEKLSNMVSKEDLLTHCKENQDACSGGVALKIDELKVLVIELHDKQSTRIQVMDEKRDEIRESSNKEMKEMILLIGELKGQLMSKIGTN